jgi:hypothetical protein
VPIAAAADLEGWAVLVVVIAFGATEQGNSCTPTSAAPLWMWLAAFVAFTGAITLASSARARKNYDTRAAAVVFWVSVVSLFAMLIIAAMAHGFTPVGCSE